MAEIAWNNAGTMLAYTCKPLTGTAYAVSTDSDIFVYDVASGQTQNICKPTNFNTGELIESSRDNLPGYDKYPVWSPDDRMIAFLSQRRAGNESDKSRLFPLRLLDGRDARPHGGVRLQRAERRLGGQRPRMVHRPRSRARTRSAAWPRTDGEVEVLTKGDHSLTAFTTGGGRMVAERSTISSATEFFEVNTSDGSLTQISAINDAIYKNIRMGEVQKRWVRTTDGKADAHVGDPAARLRPGPKVPDAALLRGGPQSVVANGWSYRWNFQLMAAQGYVVVAPNRRGVPSFGQEWLDQISGDYSGQNIRDYLSAIDDVAREPWADEERMGCVGASYGGYSVYFLAGCHKKRFKAFIAHCGIFDFDSMYGETEELWFVNNDYGGPYWDQDNATAQRSYANSPHKFVEKWDTPILIFTGEKDFRIPYTQSLEAFTAARVRGIRPGWWSSATRRTRSSNPRTRWSGTANSSAGSTATSKRPNRLIIFPVKGSPTAGSESLFCSKCRRETPKKGGFMMKNRAFVEFISKNGLPRLFLQMFR